MYFVSKIVLREKIVLLIEKHLWTSRLKSENLQKKLDQSNNSFKHHTRSVWNIIIQWTSYDDLTEKNSCFISLLSKTCQIPFVIWQKNCLRLILSGWRFDSNLQINLEVKRMDGSSWNFFCIIFTFNLILAGEVLFTVNGLL